MLITFKVDNKGLKNIEKLPERYRKGLIKGMRDAMYIVEQRAKQRFGEAGELHARTGHLRRSINTGVDVKVDRVIGYIGSPLIYAAIHEFGGTIKAKHKPLLRFQIDGHWISKKEVKIPARPYLRPSITERIDKIRDKLLEAITRETNE